MVTHSLNWPTAGAADRVEVASASLPWSQLTSWTVIALLQMPIGNAGREIMARGTSGSNNRRIGFGFLGTSGNLRIDSDRATADLDYRTSANFIALNRWFWLAGSLNINGTAGALAKFYGGQYSNRTEIARITASTAIDGSGAFQSDAGVPLTIGNTSSNINSPRINLAYIALSQYELGQKDIGDITRHPLKVPGALGIWFPGMNGRGAILDVSGNRAHGTINGNPVPQPVNPASLSQRPVRLVA
jgi:hypothetical protein